jgi:phenylacetate-CoA ligase
VIRRALASARVLAAIPRERRIPFLPAERINELRDARVRSIVRYAAETVPFYRDLFRREGLDPRDFTTAADLERLPLIDRETMRSDPQRFVSTSELGRTATPFTTSGTTGAPLPVAHDRAAIIANLVHSERQRVVEAGFCGRSYRYTAAHFVGGGRSGTKVRALNRRYALIALGPKRVTVETRLPVARMVEEVNRIRPDLIVGHGSYIEALFRSIRARGLEVHRPRVVLYVTDLMTDDARRMIEEEFAAPVISHYSAIESFKIGFTCEERDGFHLHSDLCHLRTVTPAGKDSEGAGGEVVISNLVNRGTVLLNYRLGDVGRLAGRSCPCGRSLPLLAELEGRVEDVIHLAGGEFVHGRAVWAAVRPHADVLQYQLVQREPTRFELRLRTADAGAFERVSGPLATSLRELLGRDSAIEVRREAPIASGSAGKHRAVLSLCEPPAVAARPAAAV